MCGYADIPAVPGLEPGKVVVAHNVGKRSVFKHARQSNVSGRVDILRQKATDGHDNVPVTSRTTTDLAYT